MMKSVSWFGMGGGRSSSSRRLASVTEESASSSTGPSSSNKRRQQRMTLTKRTASLSSLRGSGGGSGGNDQDSKNDSTSTMSSHEDVLELYRGEIDDLRRQLRESQEARVKEEEKEMQIVELRRQLDEARREAGGKDLAPAPSVSEQEEQRQDQQQHTKEQDAEAVANAIRYLDEVIQRVSKSSSKPSRKQGAHTTSASKSNALDDVDATPVKANKKLVQLEFCPTLNQAPPLGGSKRTISPPPALAASDGDAEEHDDDDSDSDDSGSWHAAGAIKLMADEMTSIASSSSLHTAADGMSSMHTAAGTSTALSMSDASSWLPVGKMAAALMAAAADDSTVNTTSNDTWMTAADDDLDDMQTCISALTSHTGSAGRSRGASVATTATRADDSAVVVAELYRIQSLLQSVLREKEGSASRGGVGNDSKNRPSIQRVSSRAKKIATLWEKNLSKEEEEKNEPTKTTTKQDKVEAAPLTKESAEQIITSLAGLF